MEMGIKLIFHIIHFILIQFIFSLSTHYLRTKAPNEFVLLGITKNNCLIIGRIRNSCYRYTLYITLYHRLNLIKRVSYHIVLLVVDM